MSEYFGTSIPASTLTPTFNISGFKLNSSDNKGLPGWNIRLLNITTGLELANKTTDSMGFYSFTGLTNGTYNVTEEMKAGWINTSPMLRTVTINGQDTTNMNFTNTLLPPTSVTKFNISGFKVNDTNGNNMWDSGEMGIEGWNIMLLDDKDNQIASTSTNDSGFYEFMNLAPGTYKVTEEMKEGFTPISGTSKEVTIKDMDVKDVNFLNMMVTVTSAPTPTPPSPPPTTNTISGFKINDLNGNGKQDAGEEGLSGWNIKLTGIIPETTDIHEETTTDDQGFYSFGNLPSGMYLVEETVKGDFVPTSPPVITVTVENGMKSMNNNFMNKPVSNLSK